MNAVDILFYLWELPQNLLGLLLSRIMAKGQRGQVREFRGTRILRSDRMRGGISLGRYIILSATGWEPDIDLHEWGHSRQSRLLGPFYLPVVGIPSLLWAAWWRPGRKHGYYTFYTERWADRLAGIQRRIT